MAMSYSRPRVSNDNPYSESLFRTVKYYPKWPAKGFNYLEATPQWMWFVLWPASMRTTMPNFHSTRRLFRSYEPFLSHESVKTAACTPIR